MGAELARKHEAARRVFEEADEALGFAISKLCWEGPEAELVLTANTQPAILTTSIAVLRALQARGELGFDLAAGHSLGELTALVAVGALGFADAVRLVRLRGQAMQEAVPAGTGGMAVLMGLELAQVEAVCAEAAQGEHAAPANFNGGGQIVVAGHAGAMERVIALAKQKGAKLARSLPVSAPFHCALMKPAADKLEAALRELRVGDLAVPVVTNVEATPNQVSGRVKDLLVQQVTAPVRWGASVQRLAAEGVERALELGSGAVLSGLVKRVAPTIKVTSIGEPHEVEAFRAA
jgi:[acyl-carrier-protein] S-malonyltransferase